MGATAAAMKKKKEGGGKKDSTISVISCTMAHTIDLTPLVLIGNNILCKG